MSKLLDGAVTGVIWVAILAFFVVRGAQIPDDIALVTTAIVVAGAMAGGTK